MRYATAALLSILLAACAIAPTQPISSPDTQTATAVPSPTPAPAPADLTLVTLNSPSPLIAIRVMVKAGSTADPLGKEGLAALTAESLIQGSFGTNPVITKERLAEITQPWGADALPAVLTSSDATTFRMTVPRDVLGQYLDTILRPMFSAPQFAAAEIDRLKNETQAQITAARFEDLENLGLAAIDEYVNEGTRYQHPPFGTEQGVAAITRDDVLAFYNSFYRPGNIILGISTEDAAVTGPVAEVFRTLNSGTAPVLSAPAMPSAAAISGRQAVVIDVPNAPAASVHLGFPLALDRSNPDYWALYVANTWFGTHRDSFGRLYQAIRQERGYNYGNYSYLEHWNGRTSNLFQVFNQPRRAQYFSIWLRPVAHEYAYPMMKAATYELDRLVHAGLTDEQVAAGKNKAKVLYVNLGETIERILAARMDDAFYGVPVGFLEDYLENVDRVTTDQVNAALRKYLQTQNIKYIVATDSAHANALAAQIRANGPAFGKSMQDYQFEQVKLGDGRVVWQIPEEKLEMLRVDALWANHPLNVLEVRVVPVTSLFKTGQFIDQSR